MDAPPRHSRRSSVHRAFLIPEIQLAIFEFLLVGDESSGPCAPQEDLMATAITCKAFTDAALSIKWRKVCDLNLLRNNTLVC